MTALQDGAVTNEGKESKLPRTNTLTILGTYTRHTKHYSLAGEDWRALQSAREKNFKATNVGEARYVA